MGLLDDDTKLAYQLGIMQSEINALNKSHDLVDGEIKTDKARIKVLEEWKNGIMSIWATVVTISMAIGGLVVFLVELFRK